MLSPVRLSSMSGEVMHQAAKALKKTHYDYALIGGGMLGLACAFYLKVKQPEASIIIIEQDGIPSEQGASFVSPAIAHSLFEDEALRQKASWTLERLSNLPEETGVDRPHDLPFHQVGLLRFVESSANSFLAQAWEAQAQAFDQTQRRAIEALILHPGPSVFDPLGGYGSAEAVALHYGFGAVARGCDLMLNTRVLPLSEKDLALERLAFNRQMKREVVRVERLKAQTVIVAAGAATPALLEEGAGVLLASKRLYKQYPRVEADARLPLENGKVALPVVQHKGFTLRPQGEGLLIVPPPLPPDPAGYIPQGGKLMSVPVGLRRELLEQLIKHSDALPVLGWQSLNLGKTVTKVRGCWDLVPPDGLPIWQRAEGSSWYALMGGEQGFSLGLWTAFDLATALAS